MQRAQELWNIALTSATHLQDRTVYEKNGCKVRGYLLLGLKQPCKWKACNSRMVGYSEITLKRSRRNLLARFTASCAHADSSGAVRDLAC